MASQGPLHQHFADDVQTYIHSTQIPQMPVAAVSQMCMTVNALESQQREGVDLPQPGQIFPESLR